MPTRNDTLDRIATLAKRRGFVYPSAEIYGPPGAIYDFGPLGVLLRHNIRREWWRRFVQEREDVVGIETAIITRREVLVASGHEAAFYDPLVECRICHERFRADEEIPPAPDHLHDLTEPKQFNLMFKTYLGPTEESSALAYLRPETAQGMFTNFKAVLDTVRVKVPFGIAQIGKSFRNEITTGKWIFRLREFEIAEIEYFVRPGSDEVWFETWLDLWETFFVDLGVARENLRRYEHPPETLAHYSKRTVDLQYRFPFGWGELAGVANRTDYDLRQHQQHSGRDLTYFDETDGTRYHPYVIEPTVSIERAMLVFLLDAYREYPGGRAGKEEGREVEVVLHLHPRLAPVTVAVLPLVKRERMPQIAREVAAELRRTWVVEYDENGSIGRRYRRYDEIGTPWCITVDSQTQKDETVTVRDRDSMAQDRVKIAELRAYLAPRLEAAAPLRAPTEAR
ncbi:MAG: glycine--tRNA ligase [Armatimonadota bacterium]|nr:glycine--tRNA ligase [Armatimonadota bacterium]MDR7426807.1 glycine--tRNA ligase [Armatimonadota bacterium]MDR7463944.1 glycine--tRNA ligase [Armatimonadota bacterium]MDR7469897.1 glycine--tRNA ligase [Armatimonadota bacterium]MDR7474357.1 glycine--tRNA ligase [Armatimonadota bacterium]